MALKRHPGFAHCPGAIFFPIFLRASEFEKGQRQRSAPGCFRTGVGKRKSGGRRRVQNKMSGTAGRRPIGACRKVYPRFKMSASVVKRGHLDIARACQDRRHRVIYQIIARLQTDLGRTCSRNVSRGIGDQRDQRDLIAVGKQLFIVIVGGKYVIRRLSGRPGRAGGTGRPRWPG